MSEFSQHMPPEQADQLKELEQQLLDAATEVAQTAQNIDSRQRGGATRPEGPPEGDSHDGVIEVGPGSSVEYSGEKPVVITRKPHGASRPQGPAVPAGVLGGRFAEIQQTEYKNGVKHVYGVDENGKKQHLSFDAVLESYGHAGDVQGKRTEQGVREAYKDYDTQALVYKAREANESGDVELRETLRQMVTDRIAKSAVDNRLTPDQHIKIRDQTDAFILSSDEESNSNAAEADQPAPELEPSTAETVMTVAELRHLFYLTVDQYNQALANGDTVAAEAHMAEFGRIQNEIHALNSINGPTAAAVSSETDSPAPLNGGEAEPVDPESAIREQYKDFDEEGLVKAAREAHENNDEALRDILEQMALDTLAANLANDKITVEQFNQLQDDFADFIRGGEVSDPSLEVSTPVTDSTEQGIKARVGLIWGKAKNALLRRQALTHHTVNNLAASQVEARSKRRGIYTGAAIGSLILGAYIANKQGWIDIPLLPSSGDGGAKDVVTAGTGGRGGNGGEGGSKFVNEVLQVRPNEGFEDTLQHQYGLSDAQSHQVFEQMRPSLEGSSGTYLQGTDLRIRGAGPLELNEENSKLLKRVLKGIRRS